MTGLGLVLVPGLLAAAVMRGLAKRPPRTPCHGRRQAECEDSRCAWAQGAGCRDRDSDASYFVDGAFSGLEPADAAARKRFCRCALHVMTEGRQNPYAVCAASVGTTTGGASCQYDYRRLALSQLRAYAAYQQRKGRLPRGPNYTAAGHGELIELLEGLPKR